MEALPIAADTVVTLSYALFDEKGAPLAPDQADGDDPSEPVSYVHGYGQIVPGIERQIEGLHAGDKRTLTVAPDEAFGERDEEAVFEVDKADFPDASTVSLGDEFIMEDADGDEMVMRVVEVRPEGFLVDANHPLAGHTLRVEVSVSAVRAASEEEIAAAQAALQAQVNGGACGCGHDHDHGGEDGHDHAHDHGHTHEPALVQLGKKN